jgi:hypothetical protein
MEAGESIYLAFENFGSETLEYDPILGIESTESTGFVPDTMTLAMIGGAVVVILLILVVVRRR